MSQKDGACNLNNRIAIGTLIYVKAALECRGQWLARTGALALKDNRLSSHDKFSLDGGCSNRARYGVGIIAAQGPLCPMRYERSAPKPPLCPNCAQAMRLARTTPRFGDLPDVYTFECQACDVSHIEAE